MSVKFVYGEHHDVSLGKDDDECVGEYDDISLENMMMMM